MVSVQDIQEVSTSDLQPFQRDTPTVPVPRKKRSALSVLLLLLPIILCIALGFQTKLVDF